MAPSNRLDVYWYRDELHCVRLGPHPVQHLFCTQKQLCMLESALLYRADFSDALDRVFVAWPEDMIEAAIREIGHRRRAQDEQNRLLVERRNPPKAGARVLARLAATLSSTPTAVLATYGDLTVGELEAIVEILDRPELRVTEL